MLPARKIIRVIALASIAVFLVALSACKPESSSDSVDDCMSKFADAVNSGDYGAIGELLSKDATKYSQATAASFWETKFAIPTGQSFTYSVSGNTATGAIALVNYVFTFAKDSDDNYRIRTVSQNGTVFFD